MALLPNPWDGALPTSKEQPGIVVTLRSFHNVHKRCHSGSYPYKLPRDKPDWLRHYEILGRGPPPTDVDGNPGDIYVDVNPPLVVYYRTMDDWEAWNDRPALDGTVEKLPLVCHPMLIDRYLWRNQQTLTWVTEGTIRSTSDNEILPKTTLVDPTDTIVDIFRHTSKMNIGGGADGHHPSFSVSQISGTARNSKRQESTPQSIGNPRNSQGYKKRKLEHATSRGQGNSASTGNTDDSEDDPASGAHEDIVFLGRSGSRSDRTGDSLSTKASELSAFITEADKARLSAEQRAERLRMKLVEVGDALKKEIRARIDAEAKIVAMDLADRNASAKEHELEAYKEKLARIATSRERPLTWSVANIPTSEDAEEREQERKAREEVESRLRREEALRLDAAMQITALKVEIEELTALKDDTARRLEQASAVQLASDATLTRIKAKIRELVELEGWQM